MKAVRIHEWGNVDVVKLEEIETPKIKENEVLIEVYAAGVNPIDWKVREGYFASSMKDHFPFAMGWDCSGKVAAKGAKVTHFEIGDEVIGLLRFPEAAGTFAEFVTAPEDQICHKPATFDHIHSAAVPLVGLTAWQNLFDLAKLKAKDKILIHAASGAVGQFVIQLAKYKGATVIAVASNESKDLLTTLGADQFIDYKKEKFENIINDVDVVFDGVGGDTAMRSLSVLKSGGVLISIPAPLSEEIVSKAKEKQIQTIFPIVKPNAEQLHQIVHLIDDGLLQIKIEKTFPLAQIKEALNLQQAGHCHGKVVIKVK